MDWLVAVVAIILAITVVSTLTRIERDNMSVREGFLHFISDVGTAWRGD
jgi:hypothetical protein